LTKGAYYRTKIKRGQKTATKSTDSSLIKTGTKEIFPFPPKEKPLKSEKFAQNPRLGNRYFTCRDLTSPSPMYGFILTHC